jgi:hypothetical protein
MNIAVEITLASEMKQRWQDHSRQLRGENIGA